MSSTWLSPLTIWRRHRISTTNQAGLQALPGGTTNRITLDFFGYGCAPPDPGEPATPQSLYPRHFGVTFREAADFEALHACAVTKEHPFYHDVSLRFEGLEEHRTFVLVDPQEPLEFKHLQRPPDDVLRTNHCATRLD